MAEKPRSAADDKRGGYSGSKPGSHMAPPAKAPSGVPNNGKGDNKR